MQIEQIDRDAELKPRSPQKDDRMTDEPFETIRMVGGPMDGAQTAWLGGDTIVFERKPVFGIMEVLRYGPPSPQQMKPEQAIYRRSATDRSRFEYQG